MSDNNKKPDYTGGAAIIAGLSAAGAMAGGMIGQNQGSFVGCIKHPAPDAQALYQPPAKTVEAVVREKLESDPTPINWAPEQVLWTPAQAYSHVKEMEVSEITRREAAKEEALQPIADAKAQQKIYEDKGLKIGAGVGAALPSTFVALTSAANGIAGAIEKRRRKNKDQTPQVG
jgi:hypothetical protein